MPIEHNTNRAAPFEAVALDLFAAPQRTRGQSRDTEALDAVRRLLDKFGVMPTQDSWTAAGMSPCERTVRKRFGSFREAIDAAALAGS